MIDLQDNPHRRFNPLTREWVLVSPHRTKRPWQGQVERITPVERQSFDATCYLCPGNPRAGGQRNPSYTATFVFVNDFAALLPDTPEAQSREGELLIAKSERGTCRVVCFSPDHSLTLARMTPAQIRPIVDTWISQYQELSTFPYISYVQIFENRGEMMGCSNPHPHGQIWASDSLPNEIEKENTAFRIYSERHNSSCLLCDYVALERKTSERMILENNSFAVLVPFWAVWPFEILLISKRHFACIDELTGTERDDLSAALQRIGARYDNLFSVSFPYTMGFHQASVRDSDELWHFHAHYYPPLLRSATVRKFMVGYEMLVTPQRDISPETAAARLRETSEIHR